MSAIFGKYSFGVYFALASVYAPAISTPPSSSVNRRLSPASSNIPATHGVIIHANALAVERLVIKGVACVSAAVSSIRSLIAGVSDTSDAMYIAYSTPISTSPPNGRMRLVIVAIASAATITRSGWFFCRSTLVMMLLSNPMNAPIANSIPMVSGPYPASMMSNGMVMSRSAQ